MTDWRSHRDLLERLGLEPVPAFTRSPAHHWGASTPAGPIPASPKSGLPLHVRRRSDRALMTLVPEGLFTLGQEGADPAWAPAHQQYLDDFYVDVFPITAARYAPFLALTGRAAPPDWERLVQDPDRPVTSVTWVDAAEYAVWAGVWLPSQAEWEKAARGVGGLEYLPGSGDADLANPSVGPDQDLPPPVGRHPELASPFGMEDAVGCVYQWCADPTPGDGSLPEAVSREEGREDDTPRITDEGRRVIRGAPWAPTPRELHLACRTYPDPDLGRAGSGSPRLGFRCALRLRDLVDRVGY